MAKAKLISSSVLGDFLAFVAKDSQTPLRDYVIYLLSHKAGMRVGEIASLNWGDVTDEMGDVTTAISISPITAKFRRGRTIPMHASINTALKMLWLHTHKDHRRGGHPVIRGNVVPRMTPNNLQKYMSRQYAAFGLDGCSSHSGRRTAITLLARRAGEVGASLRDVQKIAGHSDLSTTEGYIELSDRHSAMIGLL